jgi:hypothetical protein
VEEGVGAMNKYLEKIALNRFESHIYEQAGSAAKSAIAAKFGNQGMYLGAARRLHQQSKDVIPKIKGKKDVFKDSANALIRESRKVKS